MQTINDVRTSANPTTITKRKWIASVAINFRRKRLSLFKSLITQLPRPLYILDVGGTQDFWEQVACIQDDVHIIVLNIEPTTATAPNIKSVVGDARDMHEFQNQEFEVVFSNAVIEHVGNFAQQRAMAKEVQRVGKRYIIQTPNRHFPIEPHVLIPFFQFLPLWLKIYVATHIPNWGWKASHIEELSTIRLLTEKELKTLFPGAKVYKEKFLGLTKSFILYKGW
jgi:hypothetical protein